MAEERNPQRDLIELLRDSAYWYTVINDAVDIANPNMPVISSVPEDLLHSYLILHGEQSNRHGGFNTAESYKSFRCKAQKLAELPEVKVLMGRIELARTNLETSIRALDPKLVLKCGYELKEDDGKLLVYHEAVHE